MIEKISKIYNEVNSVLIGCDEAVKKCIIALIAGGHILLEDSPGVGKTTLSKAIAAAVGLKTKRVQFTPDTLASDIIGFTMWDAEQKKFRFHEGAVMTNILLADEINRTSPRTQSALLQAMEEGCVSEEGITMKLEKPFMVIATQNPFGSAGTMPLPHSQLDRFMMKLSLGRLDTSLLKELILSRGVERERVKTIVTREELLKLQSEASSVHISENLAMWLAELVTAVRERTVQGLSPRAALSIAQAARAAAYCEGRDFVIPSDISELFADCAAHRIYITDGAGITAQEICEEVLKAVKPPHIK